MNTPRPPRPPGHAQGSGIIDVDKKVENPATGLSTKFLSRKPWKVPSARRIDTGTGIELITFILLILIILSRAVTCCNFTS